jgi:hypothetical protein
MGSIHGVAGENESLPYKLQEIINENKSTPFLLNPYFRIQKNDKESQKKYKTLKCGRDINKRKLKIFLQVPLLTMRIIIFFVGSLFYAKQINGFKSTKFEMETLFISHATKNNIDGEKELFFGDLPKLFNKKNCTVLYLNHTRSDHSKILTKLINRQTSKNILLMPKFLHPSETKEYLGTIAKLLKDHLKLANTYKELEIVKSNILIESIPWIFSRETYNNFNLIKRTTELQKIYQIKNVFLTLEGYNYEELLATQLTSKDKKTRLFFYQHSPLTKAHVGIQIFIKNFNQKIYILTTGAAYSKFLLALSSQNEVICVGSMKVMNSTKNLKEKALAILMTPEGTTAQSDKFLQFTWRIAKAYPGVLFIFRFHPNLVLKRTTKKLKRMLEFLDNVEVSTESLARDISRTRATMYTGSAVAIEALNHKNLPIFVNFDNNFELDVFSIGNFDYPSIDPLNFEEEFILILEKINNLNSHTFHPEYLYQKFQIPSKLVNLLKV